ncbi:hypothetical protein Btru_025293 [Bulinus truncatus]|nr:hypothetical protein Btru_025293 [Bulinus truncatus]
MESQSRASVIPVTINITDINIDSVPLFEETTKEVSVYAINESQCPSFVYKVLCILENNFLKATDADSVPNINFVLNNIGSPALMLILSMLLTVGNEARITVRGSFDYETKNLYSFTLTTTDGQSSTNVFAKVTVIVHVLVTVTVSDISLSPLSASATVTVIIVRNRPPVFNPTSITATTANETLPVNSVIATVTATDPDTGITPQFAGLNYSLVPDSRINNLFLIDSTTGIVRVKSNLASVTDNSFVLGVIATDNGGLTATATVTVPMNRNLYDPEFTTLSYTKEIPENFALGDSVVQLLARDLDANSPWNSLTFTIDSSSLSQQYFQVHDASLLTLKQSLTSNNISEFNMIISVKDKGTPSRSGAVTANVKVTVTRNYFNPVFFNDTYRVTIPEYQSVVSSIIKVGATDADTKYNKIVYSIGGDQTAASYFAINPTTGDITLKQSVNNTQISPFLIRVVATDDGPVPRTGTALVFVDVSRNYRKPEWIAGTSNTVNILENAALGASIFKLSAVDNDFQPDLKNRVFCRYSNPGYVGSVDGYDGNIITQFL